MILTDNETTVDLLNYEAIAFTITKLIAEHREQAITIGVHGDWGAGKSSILEMIKTSLNEDKKILCVKFNGWRYQGFEDAKIALIEKIVTELTDNYSLGTKAAETVKNIYKRIDYLKLARYGGELAFTTFTGIPTPEQMKLASTLFKRALDNPDNELLNKENIGMLKGALEGLIKPNESNRLSKEIGEFRKEFDELLNKAEVEQLVVLIDDLDRCLPDIAIETLEAIRLFLFTNRTAFIIAADEEMIEYSVRKHFPELPDTTGPSDYARNYLEKLIQVPFRIPILGETETRIYVTLLLIGAVLGENNDDFDKLKNIAREKLQRPWEASGLDLTTVKNTLGKVDSKVIDALNLSDQIGPILANGTHGNPRQIKRFLNTMNLRNQTAQARGFGQDIKIPVLAKLMLAERFIPHFFSQIATEAVKDNNGYCKTLSILEGYGVSEEKPKKARNGSRKSSHDGSNMDKYQNHQALSKWKNSNTIKAWAKLTPDIGEEDLRPYLFVAKDREDYFRSGTALGQLSILVEKLMGPELMVSSVKVKNELQQLPIDDANIVFEELRARIMSGGSYMNKPKGIEGIKMLVRTHDLLQSNLLNFLEALPAENCGTWAASGWEGIIKEDGLEVRLENLYKKWSESGSKSLKIALNVRNKTDRGKQ